MTVEEVKEKINEWKDMDNRLVAELKETNKVEVSDIGLMKMEIIQ